MKRTVVYDYKLLTSIVYVTQHWDIMKERYVKYCAPYWKQMELQRGPGFYDHIKKKVEGSDKPITARLESLDHELIRLTLQFLIANEDALADYIMEYEIEIIKK